MGIVFGLAAAVCWGSADFLARYSTRIIGTYRTLLFMQLFGFVGLGLYLVFSGEFVRLYASTNWYDWVWALVAALLNIISAFALYHAFEVGVISVVSPIGASYGAITVALAFLSGEKLSLNRTIGIFTALLGVILASVSLASLQPASASLSVEVEVSPKARTALLPPGIASALLAAVAFGFTFYVVGFQVTPHLGGFASVWFVRLTTLWVLPLVALATHQPTSIPRGSVWWFIAGVGILDTAAFVCNNLGLATDQVSVVTILASLFSAITVILAWIFLEERLHWSQWLGILIIFVGIVLVSL
jgi:drug/metabolite transporter (DMT)-like permease